MTYPRSLLATTFAIAPLYFIQRNESVVTLVLDDRKATAAALW
jgi:hypothetical protein